MRIKGDKKNRLLLAAPASNFPFAAGTLSGYEFWETHYTGIYYNGSGYLSNSICAIASGLFVLPPGWRLVFVAGSVKRFVNQINDIVNADLIV